MQVQAQEQSLGQRFPELERKRAQLQKDREAKEQRQLQREREAQERRDLEMAHRLQWNEQQKQNQRRAVSTTPPRALHSSAPAPGLAGQTSLSQAAPATQPAAASQRPLPSAWATVQQVGASSSSSQGSGGQDWTCPTCTFAEMSGTFINMLGQQQRFHAAIPPLGDSKAGWKIIAAIAQTMQLDSFDYPHSQAVVDEFNQTNFEFKYQPATMPKSIKTTDEENTWVEFDHPFNVDPITRHAEALQAVAVNEEQNVRINADLAKAFGLEKDGPIIVKFGSKKINANAIIDNLTADKTILVGKGIATLLPNNCKLELRALHDK